MPGARVGLVVIAAASLLVAVAAWTPAFIAPAPGLDPSWAAGLYMAGERGLDFGTDIVFTYGPLGPLGIDGAALWFGGIAVAAIAFQAALFVAVCACLVYCLQRSIGLPAAMVVAFGALVVVNGAELAFVLIAAAALVALGPVAPARSQTSLLLLGATLAAVECLVKLSLGPVIFIAALLALVGTRVSPRQLAAFVGLFLAEFLILWLLLGQSVGALPSYVTNAREIIGGYSEGFGTVDYSSWYVPVAAGVVVALVAAAALTAAPVRRNRIFAALCVLVIGFATFKESVVRLDPVHVPILLSTALLIWMTMPWRGHLRVMLAAGAAALTALVLQVSALDADADVSPVANARRFVETAKTALLPSRRDEIADVSRALMRNYYDLPAGVLAGLEGQGVAVTPFEIAVAWAYDLDWDPLPVLQDYSAYTPHLDELNADAVSAADGPERILRHNLAEVNGRPYAVDGRLATWEAPAQTVAEACNFEPLLTTDRWQLLARIPDRCGEPIDAGSVEAQFGEAVEVPRARGDLVVAELHGVDLSGIDRLKALLLRGDPRYLAYDRSNVFRITPATAGDGFLVSGPRDVIGAGPFAFAPQASELTAFGDSGSVRFDFHRIPIEGGRGSER